MKILISSHHFSPSVGGIETVSELLAMEFSRAGHEVKVITETAEPDVVTWPFEVIRHPSARAKYHLVRWCDVYFQNNISLQSVWPLLFIKKPWVVCTATWLRKPDGSKSLWEYLKKHALRFATNVYISNAMREHVGYPGFMVPNPYNSETFRLISETNRERSLVFLGRLVSDKGCDLLIQSLARLRDAELVLPLTIIGTGSEEEALKKLVAAEKLDDLVRFAGALKGEALARELNRHQVLVVPSRWEEPFGIVALEGIACGCLVVGSKGGGLPDAIGPCGVTFRNGDVVDLARAIRAVLEIQHSPGTILNHLNCHRAEVVAARYVEIFECLCLKNRKNDAYFN
jgi:glycosyltransferase involved in cell wall biosynthesis